MAACPVGAITKRKEDGIVLINKDKCIGCRYCAWACPYGHPQFNAEAKVMEKCTCVCIELKKGSVLPVLIHVLQRQGSFGEIDTLINLIREKRAQRVSLGFVGGAKSNTEPSVIYTK